MDDQQNDHTTPGPGTARDTAAPAPAGRNVHDPVAPQPLPMRGERHRRGGARAWAAAAGPGTPTGTATGATGERSAWSRLARMGRPRLTRANLVATLLAGALGFAFVTQVQSTSREGLEAMRTPDLVRILGDQNARAARLDAEVRQLQATRDDLRNGQTTGNEAVEAAQTQLAELGVLNGTAKATGPGITMTITQPGPVVTYANLLDIVEELRDAGAEAISIGNARIVADTALSAKGDQLYAGDVALTAPYVVKAIGDPSTLDSAMKIPGGIVSVLESQSAAVKIVTSTAAGRPVTIDALAQPRTPRYARPVPAPSPSAS